MKEAKKKSQIHAWENLFKDLKLLKQGDLQQL